MGGPLFVVRRYRKMIIKKKAIPFCFLKFPYREPADSVRIAGREELFSP